MLLMSVSEYFLISSNSISEHFWKQQAPFTEFIIYKAEIQTQIL